MTGNQLWDFFTGSDVSLKQLKSLGYDLYFARKSPSGDAAIAIKSLSSKLGLSQEPVYQAFNTDPGRKVLESLAEDYKQHRSWKDTSSLTKAYVDATAVRITMLNAKQPLKQTEQVVIASTTSNTRFSPSSNPPTQSKVLPLIAWSAILFSAIGGMQKYRERIKKTWSQ